MKLYEYLAKESFAEYGIPTPEGRVVDCADEAYDVAEELGKPVVVKSQVLSGKRGKAGGIQFADTPEETRDFASNLLGSQIQGYNVNKVLVEEKLGIDEELYLGLTLDPSNQCPVLIASSRGGMSIEEVPDRYIVREPVDIKWGLYPHHIRSVAERLELSSDVAGQLSKIALALFELFCDNDAELTEINPLAICSGDLVAADARLNINGDSIYRQPQWPDTEIRSDVEQEVTDLGLSYVQLDGEIAVMANGAGTTMATMDILQHYDRQAMNFLDCGGGAGMETTQEALKILAGTRPQVLLVNIFGGITRCDDVARAIANVKEEGLLKDPLVVRLVGTNEEQGIEILQEYGIDAYRSLQEAARQAVKIAEQRESEEGCGDVDSH